ncbi:hypothetical protein B0T11DRAFT_284903 [Plectosphaerella cucumerina]|uniref:Uncharacterized protein n=1 Tax=Plectosphaerella cucumerina TaxID=40658 RepID=A0A8K0TB59_9PEZI|nr:hypothetical protein B0T11DRAFT_284903 [Plectosphaerella cucumerina]
MNPYDPPPCKTIGSHNFTVLMDRAITSQGHTLHDWLRHFLDFGSFCHLDTNHDHCWGADIVRVSYDDDELFARAVRAIRRLMLVSISWQHARWVQRDIEEKNHPPEPLPVERDFSATHSPSNAPLYAEWYREMIRQHTDASPPGHRVTLPDIVAAELRWMHHNIVIEDRAALDGADPAAAWLYQHERAKKLNLVISARGGFFVYLDQEAIERLAQVPDDEAVWASMTLDEQIVLAWGNWVKIIDVEGRIDSDDSEDEGLEQGISDEPRNRRRLRLANWFPFLVEQADRDMATMSFEPQGDESGTLDLEWRLSPKTGIYLPGKEERFKAGCERVNDPAKARLPGFWCTAP